MVTFSADPLDGTVIHFDYRMSCERLCVLNHFSEKHEKIGKQAV